MFKKLNKIETKLSTIKFMLFENMINIVKSINKIVGLLIAFMSVCINIVKYKISI